MEADTEELLRCGVDLAEKQLVATRSLTRAVQSIPPPHVVNQIPTAAPPVVKTTVTHAKSWRFDITDRDHEGRILSFTATPTI